MMLIVVLHVCLLVTDVWSGPLPIFKIGLFVFLLLNYLCHPYILDTNPFADIQCTNTFFCAMG